MLRLPQVARGALAVLTLAAASACSVDGVLRPEVDVGMQTAAVTGGGLQNLVPSNPMMMSYPMVTLPEAPAATVMPAEEAECRRELQRLGVTYRDLAPIDDGGACRIDHPVEVSGFSGDITLKPAATLTCQMALTVARWTRNELAPAARRRYLSGIGTIRQGSSYSCRRIRGTSVASEHSKGNALDIMSVTLENGREIDVRRPGFFAFRQRGLLNTVRAEGCDYFTTVLGPGYDADHKDHFHFDIKARRNGYRACR
ncbi:extensin family protein [Chelativorans sp. AA-79]|uniref:extensin-like domain-containing protein n=1 Tax=Chelativorans sp. AA-79 TaxID=3028735 RepID=UPI0023F80A06|nr:extensin family protein [Chelativorans sp. AA-79]WEX11855.1 extensin family protein [Chelativorans sp. AA-79]